MTAVLEDAQAALNAALEADAVLPQKEVSPPPRKAASRDPDAPHGRDEDGTPLAPYGKKPDGVPRIKPPGPGRRGSADDKPRVESPAAAAPAAANGGAGKDYTEDLLGFGTSVWLGASSIRGGRLGPVRLPDARPYAAVFHDQLPGLAAAWNSAAQQNATVRGYVRKLSGDGSWAWVIGVAVTTAGFAAACAELAKAPAEVRAAAAEANDAAAAAFIQAQVQAMGLELQEAA